MMTIGEWCRYGGLWYSSEGFKDKNCGVYEESIQAMYAMDK